MELTNQFKKGLSEFGFTMEDMKRFYECGGDKTFNPNRLKRFTQICPNDDLPEKTDKCICNHKIKENCYITDGESIIILGNCCIKRFLPKENRGKFCEICKKQHRNTKDNRCNDCRKIHLVKGGECIICKKTTFKTEYKYCLDCFYHKRLAE